MVTTSPAGGLNLNNLGVFPISMQSITTQTALL